MDLQRVQDEAETARDARAAADQRAEVAEAQLQTERYRLAKADLNTVHREIQSLSAGAATAAELRTVTLLQDLLATAGKQVTDDTPAAGVTPRKQ